MVDYLKSLSGVESKQLLSGYVHLLLGNYRKAQEVFISNGGLYPNEAINMWTDLMSYSEVIPLAEAYAQHKLYWIYKLCAKQIEQQSGVSEAQQ